MEKKKVRGTKPTVAQAKLLKEEVGDQWVDYLYKKTKFIDPDDDKRRLSRDRDKVKEVIFVNKNNGSELVIRYE